MKTAIIGGNHLISQNSLIFEKSALEYGLKILTPDADIILFFDQAGIKTLDFVDTFENLPLIKKENFLRAMELPENLPKNIRLIFENSLRNYSRKVYKSSRECSVLTPQMYKNDEDMLKCNCLGILVSLLEILYKNYDVITFVVEKRSQRLKTDDIIKLQLLFPELKIIWI